MLPHRKPSCLRGAAPALILAALSLALPASAESATRTYFAVNVHCDIATFKLAGLKPASVRAARVTLGQLDAQVKPEVVRRGARRGTLRLRLSTLRWTSVRTHARGRDKRHDKRARRAKHTGCRKTRARQARVRRKRPKLTVITSDAPTSTDPAPQPAPPTVEFQDEFDGPAGSAPDATRWRIYGGSAPPKWGLECFVDDRQHVALDGQGNLALTGRQASSTPCTTDGSGSGYTSGGVDTGSEGTLFQTKVGDLVEIRAKITCGSGTWDALWMSGAQPGVAWPNDGEIDIFENMPDAANGQTDEFGVKQTIHGPTSSGGHWKIGNEKASPTPLCDGFHTYGVDWNLGRMDFLFDGQVTRSITPSSLQSGWVWPFDQYPEKIILDLQLGGTWGGAINTAALPAQMLVDWVRVTR
jgi:Glycosyl hydrolases family 16